MKDKRTRRDGLAFAVQLALAAGVGTGLIVPGRAWAGTLLEKGGGKVKEQPHGAPPSRGNASEQGPKGGDDHQDHDEHQSPPVAPDRAGKIDHQEPPRGAEAPRPAPAAQAPKAKPPAAPAPPAVPATTGSSAPQTQTVRLAPTPAPASTATPVPTPTFAMTPQGTQRMVSDGVQLAGRDGTGAGPVVLDLAGAAPNQTYQVVYVPGGSTSPVSLGAIKTDGTGTFRGVTPIEMPSLPAPADRQGTLVVTLA